jgi:ABC-type sugar transport system ATPase subunit
MNLLAGRCEWTSDRPWFVAQDGTRWKLPLSAHPPATFLDRSLFLGFRAEDVHVTADVSHEAAFPGLFTAEVEAIEPLGAEAWLRLRLGSTPFIARVQNDWTPRDANRASVSFAAEDLHWFEAPSGRRL